MGKKSCVEAPNFKEKIYNLYIMDTHV